MIGALVAIVFAIRGRDTLATMRQSLIDGARQAVAVGLACAIVGVIIGVPLIVSHMFVFYFGIMADLTPPVALAAFAAASIAKGPPMKIGWKATHIAIAGFVIPYMAVYDPSLMLQATPGTHLLIAAPYVIVKTIIAIGLWGGAAIGYFLRGPLTWPERIVAFAAASFLVAAPSWTDQVGFIASVLFILWHLWRTRGAIAPIKASA